MKMTIISDTHGKHSELTKDLIGGDLLIHCGDSMTTGYNEQELISFCEWFDSIKSYKCKIFIAGNHCRIFEDNPQKANEIVSKYKTIIYLQDNYITYEGFKIFGSPWQPEFYSWAFNLPRNGMGLASKWKMIPLDTDILITHSPAHNIGTLDTVKGRDNDHLGCELLAERTKIVKPILHCWGHLHSGRGEYVEDNILFVNASNLDEQYQYKYPPKNFVYDIKKSKWLPKKK